MKLTLRNITVKENIFAFSNGLLIALQRFFLSMLAIAAMSELVFADPWTQGKLPESVSAAMLANKLDASATSFLVLGAENGESVLAANIDAPQNPASLMKLVTTGAALDILGPQHVWTTRLLSSAALSAGVLKGDLFIQASGDPMFVQEHLWMLLREARARGVRELRGDLVVDGSVFGHLDHDPAQFDAEPRRAYNAGPHPLLLNYKATAVRLLPIDERLAVAVEPLAPEVALKNEVHWSDGPCGDWKSGLRAEFGEKVVTVSGRYPRACGARTWYLNVLDHDEYLRQTFLQLWHEMGGRAVPGFTVRTGVVPARARLIAEWSSPPLAEQIRVINKFSNNVMARELFIDIGSVVSGQPGTTELGAQALYEWLARNAITAPELVLENGSGLSRQERIAARTLGQLLVKMYHGPWMADYMASLPIAGLDGTVRNRLNARETAGYARLKTGSLGDVRDPKTEVRGIAGYVMGASGRWYVVVAIVNGPTAPSAQPVHDALVRWVIEKG
jgi:D-alanyl-D-alanine carboxypeptidase/D-alanyl-D-alanine-endopeptidase (penicillin-binding protein 4)